MGKLGPSKFLRRLFRKEVQALQPPAQDLDKSPILRAPEDIIFLIIGQMDIGARVALLKTCRLFRQLLEPVLYRHLDLTEPHVYGYSDKCHKTLLSRQDLIKYIVSYRGPLLTTSIWYPKRKGLKKIIGWKHSPSYGPLESADNYEASMTIFSKASNIRDLHFTDFVDWTRHPYWNPVMKGVSEMNLKALVLKVSGENSNVCEVLKAQPKLEHLELGWNSITEIEKLDPADLPTLRSVKVTIFEAAAIVPGRPVQELELLGSLNHRAWDPTLVQKLSKSSRSIITLTITLSENDLQTLQPTCELFSSALPEVENLAITVGGMIHGKKLVDAISQFKCLRTLQIHMVALVPMFNPYQNEPASSTDGIEVQTSNYDDWDFIQSSLEARCPDLVEFKHTSVMYTCCCSCGI